MICDFFAPCGSFPAAEVPEDWAVGVGDLSERQRRVTLEGIVFEGSISLFTHVPDFVSTAQHSAVQHCRTSSSRPSPLQHAAQEEFKIYQQLGAKHLSDLDKQRAEIRQFVYSEKQGTEARP